MEIIDLTGHRGLVGTAIQDQIKVLCNPEKIKSVEQYKKYLTDNNVTSIIHTAAKVGGVYANEQNKIGFYLLNSNLNNIVFEAAYTSGVKTLVNFSSTCVFPDTVQHPLKEEYIFNGPPHHTNDAYAYSKRMMQLLCKEARLKGLNYFTIVPTNIFGPNDNYNPESSHVLPGLIRKCYNAKADNKDLIVWGTGNPLREFVYSKDLAKITKSLMDSDHDFDSIIVSNSEEISIRDCVKIICEEMDFNGNVIFDHSMPDGQFRKPTDTSRLKQILPDFEFTPFRTAIKESIQWFAENIGVARI